MDDWKSIPHPVAEKAIEDVERLPIIKKNSYDELVKWRNEKLIRILKLQEYVSQS